MKKKYYKKFRIKKNFSQVFLQDKKIIDSIIKKINPQNNQKIIEIGAGLGELTKHIIKITDSLIIIELDSNFSKQLSLMFNKKIMICNQDVMKIDFSKLSHQLGQKIRLIGNLPYHITTKILMHLLKHINVIEDMHFMFQQEVAKRLLAYPDNKEYGRLSIIIQYYCQTIPLLNVPAISFIPIPKVDSMFIKLLPYIQSPYPKINVEKLSLLTKYAFRHRRKTIKNSLSTLINPKEIIKTGIDTKLRAENLTIYQYCDLINKL